MKPNEPKELLAIHFSGEKLTPAEKQKLLHALGESTSFVDEAADNQVMARLLKYRHAATESDDFTAEVLARISMLMTVPEEPDEVIPVVFSRRKWIATGAAAAFTMGGAAWWFSGKGNRKPIAWIRGVSSAHWAEEDTRSVGDGMFAGGRVKLLSGFVAIGFEKGVELVLEGAGDFEILSHNSAVIHQGSIAVYVSPETEGFTLEGPGGSVKDRGACFGVSARGNEMDVHALSGRVDAMPKGRGAITIPARTALRIHDGIADLILARPQDFLTRLPPEHRINSLRFLHWSFDEMEGELVHAKGNGFDLDKASGRFSGNSVRVSDKPTWGKGVSGGALSFLGKGDYLRTEFAGLGGSSPRTVACWVKVPADFLTDEGYALIGWGAHIVPGDTWQLSINPNEEEGPLGRLRMGTNRGQVIGTTDLRDDSWHHVAAVLFEGRPANVATHILLYVDGKLESAAAKSVMAIDTDIDAPTAYPVVIGKNTGRSNKDSKESFRGMIDEVIICAGALSQTEIIELMSGDRREK